MNSPVVKPDPLQTQVGGGHYVKQKIQPVEFTMANMWDACAHSTLKYVLRHHDKGGRQDLAKALHFVELRAALWHKRHMPRHEIISMATFCQANQVPAAEAAALHALASWVWSNSGRCKLQLQTAIENLISTYDQANAQTLDGFNEARADIIGQNGNDALAYSTDS